MPSTVTYDATNGSDTAASGAGPTTAITGLLATNGLGNIVDLDGSPDLSGVAVDDVVWVNSATTERHLSRITAVDDIGKTVTTEDLLVLSTGVTWAIGGERQTLENDTGNRDWLDWKAGWFIQFGGIFNTTAEFSPADPGNPTDGFLTLQIKPGAASLSEIVHDTTDERAVNIGVADFRLNFDRLLISNASTWGGANIFRFAGGGGIANIKGCNIFGRAASGGAEAIIASSTNVINIVNNYIHGQIIDGIQTASGGRQTGIIQGNWLDGGSGVGIQISGSSSYTSISIYNNLVTNFTGNGIEVDNNGSTSNNNVVSNTIYNCANGISVLDPQTSSTVNIRYNIIVSCSGWGITAVTASSTAAHTFEDYNAFYNNTSGEVQNVTAGDNGITLTADPFTDAANDNFNLNDTAGGGADCKDIIPFAAGFHV